MLQSIRDHNLGGCPCDHESRWKQLKAADAEEGHALHSLMKNTLEKNSKQQKVTSRRNRRLLEKGTESILHVKDTPKEEKQLQRLIVTTTEEAKEEETTATNDSLTEKKLSGRNTTATTEETTKEEATTTTLTTTD